MKRILISDEISPRGLTPLEGHAEIAVDYRPEISAKELLETIDGYVGLIVRSRTKVTAPVLEAATALEVIGRAGTGVDNVDLEAATRRGIVVMNVPGGNTVSAAEHTLAMVLAMARGIPAADRSVRAGKWERGAFVGTELEGKVLGILGMGKIGREVAHRARSFGMDVIGYDPFMSPADAARCEARIVTREELLHLSDIITIHTPLTPETKYLLDEKTLAACKRGVRIVNCARGGLLDEAALRAALASGQVAGAALDVYETEPPVDLPFREDHRVVLTPHLAASTTEALEKVSANIAEQVRDYLRDGIARNAVNVTPMDLKVRERSAPFLVLAEKLGRLHAQLIEGRLNRVTVEYSGELPSEALPAMTVAILKGYFERFLSGPVNAVNAGFIARERGIRLDEVRTTAPQDYMNLITTSFQSDTSRQEAAGTVFGRNIPRIVRLDSFRFDAAPEGHLLLVANDDRPGVVGKIGTLLGEHEVNIARMSLGRDRVGGQALAIMEIDTPLPEPLAAALRRCPGILRVRTVSL